MFKKKRKEAGPEHSSLRERNKAFICTMCGKRELDIENYGSLGNYSETCIVLHCYKSTLVIEGERLLIEYFTDVNMRITGCIHSIRF